MANRQQGHQKTGCGQRSASPPSSPSVGMAEQSPLLALARSLGATDAVLLPAETLVIEDRYAAMCGAPYRCPSYGLAPGCPPHAPSPADFRARLTGYRFVVVFKIDAPITELLDENRLHITRAIHRIAAGLERAAPTFGFAQAFGMAAGSCRELFCANETACPVLDGSRSCRHLDLARPSISAVGIDFAELAARAGWPFAKIDTDAASGGTPTMGLMAGIVLLA